MIQKIVEYKHPFVYELATHVAENFEGASKWLAENISSRSDFFIKPISDKILNAMQNYIRKQLVRDIPMKKTYEQFPIIKSRIDYINQMNLSSHKKLNIENKIEEQSFNFQNQSLEFKNKDFYL